MTTTTPSLTPEAAAMLERGDLPAPGLAQRAAVNFARRAAEEAAAGFVGASQRLADFPELVELRMAVQAMARGCAGVVRRAGGPGRQA
jgi:hypothetical protein